MQRLGGAVIPMQQSLVDYQKLNMSYQIGSAQILEKMQEVLPREPFDSKVTGFLNAVSRELLSNPKTRQYPDVVTFAFWIRKASVEQLKKRFLPNIDGRLHMGRGVAFHIAPSNVAVNYAYSLAAGLLCGNANIVRIPSKEFLQVRLINEAILKVLEKEPFMADYILLVQYGHDQAVNDALSQLADVRVVWGGDNTIQNLRQSALKPRAAEITFADRYSLAVIDSDAYLAIEDKQKTAHDFYNDTYLTDQNACTSPRIVVWTGSKKQQAKKEFWELLHVVVKEKYELQEVQAVNKLTSLYLAAVGQKCVRKIEMPDNYIVRLQVYALHADLLDYKDNSGYFFEYDCDDLMELKEICKDERCQTLSYIGDRERHLPLLKSGIRGIDRIVPVGQTMDFDFLWDGYNLFERLTRIITF